MECVLRDGRSSQYNVPAVPVFSAVPYCSGYPPDLYQPCYPWTVVPAVIPLHNPAVWAIDSQTRYLTIHDQSERKHCDGSVSSSRSSTPSELTETKNTKPRKTFQKKPNCNEERYQNQRQNYNGCGSGSSASSTCSGSVGDLRTTSNAGKNSYKKHWQGKRQFLPANALPSNLPHQHMHNGRKGDWKQNHYIPTWIQPSRTFYLGHYVSQPYVRNTPSDLLHKNEWDTLSTAVWSRFVQSEQTNDTFLRKMGLRDGLFRMLERKFPYCGLYVVGSSMNGFGINSSDMDICLMITHAEVSSTFPIDERKAATDILTYIRKLLREQAFVHSVELIRARVPILRFQDMYSDVEVDLNVNNPVGIRNTHLLHSYSKLDWRVCALILVVKLWARFHDINDARCSTLSSYSIVLMVIHYLQSEVKPSVLPNLQEMYPLKFLPTQRLENINLNEELPTYKSQNKMALGELLFGFIDYYANKFDYKNVISIRTGGKYPKTQLQQKLGNKYVPYEWKYLCIEEPFNLSNTAMSVYNEQAYDRIIQVFKTSFKRLEQTKELGSILPE